jgi:hypothetical protein
MDISMGIFTLAAHLDSVPPLRYDEIRGEIFRDP